MPAPALKIRIADRQRGVQIKRLNAATRALPLLAVQRDQDHGATQTFHNPRSDNADDARMPTVRGEHDTEGILARLW